MDSDNVHEERPVRSISEYLRRIDSLIRTFEAEHGNTQILAFRGQSCDSWELDSSAERRLSGSQSVRVADDEFIAYHEELILACKRNRFDRRDGIELDELEILAQLQHHGAATLLIDFTRNALVALWFATANKSVNGKVFVINTDRGQFREVKPADVRKHTISQMLKFETLPDEDLHLNHPGRLGKLRRSEVQAEFWHWTPANLNERMLAQHSLFIFGPISSGIPYASHITIDLDSKDVIRESLRNVHHIDEESLFPDFTGFANTQRQDAPYGPQARDYFRSARSALEDEEYSLAIRLFNEAIRRDPDYRPAYTFRGRAFELLGDLDSAIQDYTTMIKLGWNRPMAFYIRAGAFMRRADYVSAIGDYNKIIERNSNNPRGYIYRAEAYESLGDLESAIQDYSKVIELEPQEYVFGLRGALHLCLQRWNQAKADFATAAALGLDVPEFFSTEYGSVEDFEESMNVRLPDEIKSMLDSYLAC